MKNRLERNMRVRLRAEGLSDEWCEGIVSVASTNGCSVGLLLDGAVRVPGGGMYVGAIPLLIDYERETVEDLAGVRFELELAG